MTHLKFPSGEEMHLDMAANQPRDKLGQFASTGGGGVTALPDGSVHYTSASAHNPMPAHMRQQEIERHAAASKAKVREQSFSEFAKKHQGKSKEDLKAEYKVVHAKMMAAKPGARKEELAIESMHYSRLLA